MSSVFGKIGEDVVKKIIRQGKRRRMTKAKYFLTFFSQGSNSSFVVKLNRKKISCCNSIKATEEKGMKRK